MKHLSSIQIDGITFIGTKPYTIQLIVSQHVVETGQLTRELHNFNKCFQKAVAKPRDIKG